MSKPDDEVLREAREYLVEHGWTVGNMRDAETKRVCTLGAILYSQNWQTYPAPWECDPAHRADLTRLAGKLLTAIDPDFSLDDPLDDIASWNDSEADLPQTVIDLFAKAEKIELAGFDPDKGVPM